MTIFEKILLIGACVAPVFALLFVIPKIKKKQQKTFETTDYVPEKKDEPVVEETHKDVEDILPKQKNFDDEIQSYREFLAKRKERTTLPIRMDLPRDYADMTESYSAMRRRMERKPQQERNTNINNLDPEIKALLIAGILDRKF